MLLHALISGALAASAVPAIDPGDQPTSTTAEVANAIESGRLDQARLMLARLIQTGASGNAIEQLIADLDFALGRNAEALARYQILLGSQPKHAAICERAVISALRLNQLEQADPLARCATEGSAASWRAWNARGVLADLKRDWLSADEAYAKALSLAGESSEVLNNVGYSRLLRGEWSNAVVYFERAHALDPTSTRIANNLELTRAALDRNLPRRLIGESDTAWAARLNDAGVAAIILGDYKRAIAGLTQALEAHGSWYERAANNLATLKHR